MGVSALAMPRDAGSRPAAQIAGGLLAWISAIVVVLAVAALIVIVARAGWQNIVWVFETESDAGIGAALVSTLAVLGLALPPAIALSFCAGAAAAEPAIGAGAGRFLAATLRFGPSLPSTALGLAALGLITANPALERSVQANPLVAAAIVLVALNLPIMTARFRTVMRAVPPEWRVAAFAAGAPPVSMFFGVVVPRAMPGIIAVVLHGVGQMLGETAAVAIVLSVSTGVKFVNHALTFAPAPLPVHLWQRLAVGHPDPSSAPSAASETLILLVAIVVLRFVGRVLARRRRPSGAGA